MYKLIIKLNRIPKPKPSAHKYFHGSSKQILDIRNIGILAHIDAGKTTTTERMLFFSGKTRSLGEVHHGNTVTDYLQQERERGITICSSAVSFPWYNHKINLLDTPGHIDFTMEVEQSLCAIDGIVVILDASAGVEAQTMTVWSQADRHRLPRIVFANKMDRFDADFDASVLDLETKLSAKTLPLQIPATREPGEKGITGIIDIVTLKELKFDEKTDGQTYKILDLNDNETLKNVKRKRKDLIDFVSGIDDELADQIIANESLENVSNEQLLKAIRRVTIAQKIVPVLLGSAYKNCGIQPLLDAVVNFLPAPHQRNSIYNCFENDFAGRVFKVVHDKQRGPLSLVRVLSGKIRKGAKVTMAKETGMHTENVQRIYEPLADDYREINQVECGDVAIFSGLKQTSTGDLLVSSLSSLKSAQRKLNKLKPSSVTIIKDTDTKDDDDDDDIAVNSHVFSLQPKIPDAVYFCSIEPPSLSQQIALDNALKQLQREDPSLRVQYDEVTMQTVLGGMGELHLEVIKSRLMSEFKIDADLGPLQIAYKETLDSNATDIRHSMTVEKEIAGTKQQCTIELSLVKGSEELFRLDTSTEATQNLSLIRPRFIYVAKKGAISALDRGPRIGGNVIDTQIVLHNLKTLRGTADSFIMATTAQCVQKILITAGCRLLEPIMAIDILSPSDRTTKILSDLNKRRATILDVIAKGQNNKIINVIAPLAELSGYSSILRTISSGEASMTMQPHGHVEMTPQEELVAIRRSQGLL